MSHALFRPEETGAAEDSRAGQAEAKAFTGESKIIGALVIGSDVTDFVQDVAARVHVADAADDLAIDAQK